MIFNAAGDHRLAIDIPQDPAQVPMELITQWCIAQKRPSFLRGKNRVHKNLRERLGHAELWRRLATISTLMESIHLSPFNLSGPNTPRRVLKNLRHLNFPTNRIR
jgi:hypothetical protein